MTSTDSHDKKPEGINRRRLVLDLLGIALFFALFLFLPAGTWAWEKGWLFILVLLTLGVLAWLYVWRVNPEVLAARINPHRGTKGWDKALLGLFFPTGLATIPVAALDDGRSHWSAVPRWACLLGYALLVAGMVPLTFLVLDALALQDLPEVFDSVIDSGLFHVFSDEDRRRYVAGLASVLKPGGRLFLLCFSDAEPGEQGPRRVSRNEIEDAFAEGWVMESIEPTRFEVRPDPNDISFSDGGPKAWFVVVRRAG